MFYIIESTLSVLGNLNKKKQKNLCIWNQHQLNDSKYPKMFLMAREAFKFQRFYSVNILIVYVQTGFIVLV